MRASRAKLQFECQTTPAAIILKKRCVLELPRLSCPPFKSDLLYFKFFVIAIMEATMMPVEKLRGEAELASDTNHMKFFLLSVVAF